MRIERAQQQSVFLVSSIQALLLEPLSSAAGAALPPSQKLGIL
jgi:hypothetical protein